MNTGLATSVILKILTISGCNCYSFQYAHYFVFRKVGKGWSEKVLDNTGGRVFNIGHGYRLCGKSSFVSSCGEISI